jgi:hypothetical protein
MNCVKQAFSVCSKEIYRCLPIRKAVMLIKAQIVSSMGRLIQTEVIKATRDTAKLQ